MSDSSPIAIALPVQRKSRQSKVVWGSRVVTVGGGAPVVVQSMTNTDTKDAASTAQQVAELARAGSEIVRITVNNREAAAQVPEIVARLRDDYDVHVPLSSTISSSMRPLLPRCGGRCVCSLAGALECFLHAFR